MGVGLNDEQIQMPKKERFGTFAGVFWYPGNLMMP